ncbi:MAG: hypothetical protein HGA31_00085 [Candidatus Moranbacteria bacterium]|nr:hypothetical protein [Candidatus Moranbacteria bacterium]
MSAFPLPAFNMRRFLATGLLVVATLVSFRLFPTDPRVNGSVQAIVLGIAFFLLLPMAYVLVVLKEPLPSIGFSGSVRKLGFLSVPIAVVPIVSIWYMLLQMTDAKTGYSLPAFIQSSFPFFVLYEVFLVGTIAFLYEVFFRGLVMLSWLTRSGIMSVFLQAALFIAFLVVPDGFGWEYVPMMFAALSSGFVAYHTRSIYYSWFSGWVTLFLADVLFLLFGR